MVRKQTGRRRGTAGPDLQALLAYAYAVQCFRVRQQQALGKLAWHALQAVSGQSLAIGAVQKSQLRWLAAVGQSAAANGDLALPRQIADLQASSFGLEPTAGATDGQYLVHVYRGAGDVPSTAYVLIGRGPDLQGVLAICRYTEDDFSDHDVRMLRIFAMSVDQVLGWSPAEPAPEGLHELASDNEADPEESDLEVRDTEDAFLDELRNGPLFRTEASGNGPLWLKVGVASLTLVLAGLSYLLLGSRQGGTAQGVAAKPEVQAALNPTLPGGNDESAAVVPAKRADVAPRGLRVENPDPGVIVWQPSVRSHVPVKLNQVRVRKQKDQVFLIFELSGETGIRIEHFRTPERVVVRFAATTMGKKLNVRGSDPMIVALSGRSTKRGSEVEIRLKRRTGVMLVGPTADHHVIINLQG